MNDHTLTAHDVMALATIVRAATTGQRVRWISPDGDILEGTARHLVKHPENYGFLHDDTDIRDGFLRITSVTGAEYAPAVADLIGMVKRGEFAGTR